MSEQHNHGDFKFFLGFFIGGLIGAFIIFFLGTKEGKKTGKLLEDKGRDLLDEIKDKIDHLEEKGKAIFKEGEDLKEQVVDRIEDKKEEITKAAGENLDHALAKLEELQENSLHTTADLRKRLFKNLPKKR